MFKNPLILICTLLLLSSVCASEILPIKIERIHGTQLYLTGKHLLPGQNYLVFGEGKEFKGEVRIMHREKTGYYMAKEVEPVVRGFTADKYKKTDKLVKFLNYNVMELGKAPIFYAGDYFRISGKLEKIEHFGENLIYLKFRRFKHKYYTPEKKRLPFGNYYAKIEEQYLGGYYIVLFSEEELHVMPVVGTEYVCYGRFADAKPYLTFEGLRILEY